MIKILLRTAGLAALLALPAAARAEGALDAYLPTSGTIVGHVVTFSVAPEDEAISRRFRHAVQDNMDWFKKAVTSAPAGKPLPYDRHMGITEAQYEQLQHMTSKVTDGASVDVAVDRTADGTIHFAPKGEAGAMLKDLSFPPDEKSAVTPYGTLTIVNPIHQTDPAAPIGVWSGTEWAQVSDSDAKPSVKIAFGKREPDGSGVMYYQVSPFKDHKEQSLVVYYGLK